MWALPYPFVHLVFFAFGVDPSLDLIACIRLSFVSDLLVWSCFFMAALAVGGLDMRNAGGDCKISKWCPSTTWPWWTWACDSLTWPGSWGWQLGCASGPPLNTRARWSRRYRSRKGPLGWTESRRLKFEAVSGSIVPCSIVKYWPSSAAEMRQKQTRSRLAPNELQTRTSWPGRDIVFHVNVIAWRGNPNYSIHQPFYITVIRSWRRVQSNTHATLFRWSCKAKL